MSEKLVCQESYCKWHGASEDALRAPNPFNEKDTLLGCPECKGVNTLAVACDEPECWEEATCGFPTTFGYRRTCGEHWRKVK